MLFTQDFCDKNNSCNSIQYKNENLYTFVNMTRANTLYFRQVERPRLWKNCLDLQQRSNKTTNWSANFEMSCFIYYNNQILHIIIIYQSAHTISFCNSYQQTRHNKTHKRIHYNFNFYQIHINIIIIRMCYHTRKSIYYQALMPSPYISNGILVRLTVYIYTNLISGKKQHVCRWIKYICDMYHTAHDMVTKRAEIWFQGLDSRQIT